MTETIDLSQKTILVVEDDDMNFIYLNQIFRITKGHITRARNGEEALDLVSGNQYDIILMDIQLPDIPGTEVTRKIREFDQKTPIIAQTASRTPDETDVCLESGCTDLLIKPYTLNDFSRVVGKYV
jgi:CheY-like chemotaxis protein